MRSAIPILFCCLYALSAVDATPFSERGNAEIQQGSAKVVEPQNFWSDDKSDDDDKDDKDDHHDKDSADKCASRSVSVLLGTSTFSIPCLGAGSIVDINGLLAAAFPSLVPSPMPSSAAPSSVASSSVASSSAVDSSSASSVTTTTDSTTDSTTTTTDTTTTTTATTTTDDSIIPPAL
ncbi:hypothetical protein K450DRAFT_270732 [Umbelopsis ramanniana AG]|uniref:Uncharacterized protein n=1 Tax=Umbelopsis ramanniana AG TaxID=1314678 RepID=A0AAD5HFH1_UMBRA|nr:uncharacterized protein K450DRAFT_270732 [Umbelopsis ramanniana AG]KAI8580681.1 hypothetical protein K450DRAFT_270732 [Umbelopsis ramanniana AG]